VLRDAVAGTAAALRDPPVLALLVLTALDNLAIMGPAIVGAAGFVHDDLGKRAGHFAWFEGAMAAGYVVGALGLARFGARARKGPLVLAGMVLDGLTYVPFFWVRDYGLALALVFVHGLFIPWIVVGRTAFLQQHVPEARRGQVFALVNLTVQGMTALSALVAGLVVGILQAATQLNEGSVSFVVKVTAVLAALLLAGPSLAGVAVQYTRASLQAIEHVVR
jgi:flagellar biosynthetic protein FliQ